MRRLALVAEAEAGTTRAQELDAAERWLATLPCPGVRRYQRLAEVPLQETDVLWADGTAAPDPRLLPWLSAGGRLLATREGALLATALGLADDPPELLHHDLPSSSIGLAGFGSHPLFGGLRDGAVLVPAADAEGPGLYGYDGHRPDQAAVVAVARRGLEVDPHRTLAWEYAVGAGGILCLGFSPSLLEAEGAPARREAEVVLANALVGDAIPHRERSVPAVAWPPAGRQATGRPSPEPLLVAPADPWR